MSKREPVSSVNLLNAFLFRNFTILIIFCSHDTMRFCTAPIQALSRHLLWVVFVLLANRASFLAVCWFGCGWWRCSRLLFCSVLCFGSSVALFVASGSVWLVASWCSSVDCFLECTGHLLRRVVLVRRVGGESGAVLTLNRHALGLWAVIMILSWAMICGIWIELSLSWLVFAAQ